MIAPEKIGMARTHLMTFFNQWFYPEHRIRDVESLGYLNKKKNYRLLISRLTTSGGSSQEQACVEVNRILIQQEILKSITYMAHCYEEVSQYCWKEIDNIFTTDYSAEINQTKLYQYLKLAISIMRNDELENKTFH